MNLFLKAALRAGWFWHRITAKTPPPSYEETRWRHRNTVRWRQFWQKRRPLEPLFIVGSPRTGSNLLASYLNAYEQISIVGEPLNISREPIGIPETFSKKQALRHLDGCLQTTSQPIAGAKLFFVHLENFGLTWQEIYLLYPNAKFILLYRENLTQQFLSIQTLRQTGQATGRISNEKLHLSPEKLQRFFQKTAEDYRQFLTLPFINEKNCRILSYETLTQSAHSFVNTIAQDWYNLPPVQLETRLTRQNRSPLSERVENYSQIEPLLAKPESRLVLQFPNPNGFTSAPAH